jgi:hypothetical protein
MQILETPYQLEPPISRLSRDQVQEVINSLNTKISSGYDLVSGKILKGLPITGIKYLHPVIQCCLAQRAQWKVCTDHPHLEARETPSRVNIPPPNKPPLQCTYGF